MHISPLPLARTAKLIRSGELSLIEFVEEICDRIDVFDPVLQTLLPETNRRKRLLSEAQALMVMYPEPENRPPLFGIPVGVKDIFRVDGFPTKAGSRMPANEFEGEEAWAVTALKRNGALILGKTVTTEFAFFEPGPTRNPHNPEHTPGGSSSGSAAAVAAGFTPFALGTQTIGSVLRPAAFCGVFGFKPTQDKISTKGIVPFSPTADHVGFFAQDLEGIQLASQALVPNWKNTVSKAVSVPTAGAVLGKYLNQADEEVRHWFRKTIRKLKSAGIPVVELDSFGDISEINRLHRAIIARDFARVHHAWFEKYHNLYSNHSKELIMEGRAVPEDQYNTAISRRGDYRGRLSKVMQEMGIDVWISPSTTSLAPRGIASTGSPLMNLPWTYLGVPALSVPAGFSQQGLPFGLQVAGRFNHDEELLLSVQAISAHLGLKM